MTPPAPAADWPVIDAATRDAPVQFVRSLRESGFAVLTHHGLPEALVAALYAGWMGFFRQPVDDKAVFAFDAERQDGWFGTDVSETAEGQGQKDLKEFFHVYPDGRLPARLRSVTLAYRDHALRLASRLLQWVQDGLPADVATGLSMPLPTMIDGSGQTLLRVVHYPPLTGAEPPGAWRAAPHQDINLLTVLPAASAPGLQVQGLDGGWRNVPCDFGAVVVNTGDMLAEATGGWLAATPHRVANPTGTEAREPRLSLPLFLHPRPDVRLSARHTQASYLAERLRALGLKRA